MATLGCGLAIALATALVACAGCQNPAGTAAPTAAPAEEPAPAPEPASEDRPFELTPQEARLAHVASVLMRALRPATPVIVNVQPVRGSVHRLVAPVGGTFGVPTGADWPEAAQRVRRGQAMVAIVTDADLPQGLRSTKPAQNKVQDGPRLWHLRSPDAGVVLAVLAHPGGRAKMGDEVLHVAPAAVLELAVPMNADDAAATPMDAQLVLQPADGPVRVVPVAGRRPGLRADAVVWRVDNGDDLLSPGQQLKGVLRAGVARETLTTPVGAVFAEGGQRSVYVRLGSGAWQLRKVQIQAGDGEFVAVVQGLKAGEEVAVKGVEVVRGAMSRARAAASVAGD